jgi:hypothetical protein
MTNAIETWDLCYRAGKDFELRDLALRVREGSICGFLGPNGAGARACQAGAASACLAVLGLDRPGEAFGEREMERDFLAWLLATEEPDQFARFWRSSAPVQEALASACGRPAGETASMWARQRLRGYTRPRVTGPRMLLAGVSWLSLAMVVAFVAMHRRQVS